MSKNKQSNFRINPEDAEVFRQYCESNGWTQAQGFDHIIQILELKKKKTSVAGRAVEIETFEKYVKDILAAYLYSIELSDNAEARVREQFESALIRKDRTIEDLQEKVKQLFEEKEATEASREMINTISVAAEERAKNALEQLENMKKAIADQERINAMLTSQFADATEKLDGYEILKKSESSLKEEVIVLKNRIIELERTLSDAKKESENALKNAQTQADLIKERAVMAKEREMHNLVREVDKENAHLTAKIEQLQAENTRLLSEK